MSTASKARRGIIGAAIVVVAYSWIGLAASLALATDTVAANRVATPRCTNAAMLVVPNLSGSNVASVTVSTLPSACGSATIQVAVNNGSTSSTGTATVPVGGGSVTVTLSVPVAATAGEEFDLVLMGP